MDLFLDFTLFMWLIFFMVCLIPVEILTYIKGDYKDIVYSFEFIYHYKDL